MGQYVLLLWVTNSGSKFRWVSGSWVTPLSFWPIACSASNHCSSSSSLELSTKLSCFASPSGYNYVPQSVMQFRYWPVHVDRSSTSFTSTSPPTVPVLGPSDLRAVLFPPYSKSLRPSSVQQKINEMRAGIALKMTCRQTGDASAAETMHGALLASDVDRSY